VGFFISALALIYIKKQMGFCYYHKSRLLLAPFRSSHASPGNLKILPFYLSSKRKGEKSKGKKKQFASEDVNLIKSNIFVSIIIFCPYLI
jgi:hypothetical protein